MQNEKPVVMVVEDEALLLRAITTKLKNVGFDSVSCTSGSQAFEYLNDLSKNSNIPDIIWLDYYLGDMDGITFISTLRENPSFSNIPVVVVSNSSADDKVKGMLAMGVKLYLVKAEHSLDDIVSHFWDYIDINKKEQQDE